MMEKIITQNQSKMKRYLNIHKLARLSFFMNQNYDTIILAFY